MCPNCTLTSKKISRPIKRQEGFLIPLAIFIVVVMGLLALALARTTTQTGLATAQELLSVQAFYAAESGAQAGMGDLFYPSPGNRAQVNNRCEIMNLTPAINGAAGLGACTANVTCECKAEPCDAADLTSFYTITSEGSCGSGAIRAVRTIKVGAFLDKDQEI